ncbi:hypothetical protein [Agarivorans litoreus]|uniref:hypothetical protein n=1 Tax=Agarivorans litoreus TaxID=1510455 RepID=UPI001C7D6CD4|nr:hypothetical protein [Agarivorans litoreus]
MKMCKFKTSMLAAVTLAMVGCADEPLVGGETPPVTPPPSYDLAPQPIPASYPAAHNGDMLLGNPDYLAISYGAWRTTTRESGANVPSVDQQKEDMLILAEMGIKVIRTYNTQGFIGLDGKSNTENLLQAIKELREEDSNFEMYVMLGVWIDALNSWTDLDVIHDQENPANALEIAKAKELALAYPDIVKVIAVGNEAMVDWAEYHVVPKIILDHVTDLQSWKLADEGTADIWITSSDNHAVWAGQDPNGNTGDQADLKALIAAMDYVSLHTYAHHDTYYDPEFSAAWKVPESQQNAPKKEQIDSAMEKALDRTIDQFAAAQVFVNSVDNTKPIHLGETGWSTVSTDYFGAGGTQAADEYKQKVFYDDMREFSNNFGASLFFFQAFDEPWKGDPNNPSHSEKHFGLIDINGNVKHLAWDKVDALNSAGLTRGNVASFNASYGGDEVTLMDDVLAPPYAPVETPPVEGEFKVLGSTLYAGATAYGWDNPITAWAGVDDASGVLTIVADPALAANWGWGAGVGIAGQTTNLSSSTQMTFEIRGVNSAESTLAEFGFWLGYQSTGGDHWLRFNEGQYTLTDQWQRITVDLNQFSSFGSANLGQIVSPFTIADVYSESGGSAPTKSSIEVRNISWLE